MARKSRARAKIGRRTGAAGEPATKCDLLAAGAFCPGAAYVTSTEEHSARPRDEFARARVRADVKEASRGHRKRRDRAGVGATASLDPGRIVRMRGWTFERSELDRATRSVVSF